MKDPSIAAPAFTSDISFPGMLYAVTLRSPVAGGVLSAIECPELPGSCSLITAEHIPGKNELADFPVPVLADKALSYIGEPVAILVGPEELKLEALASRIKIIAEEKAPVEEPSAEEVPPAEDDREIIVRREIVKGEPDSAFETCRNVVAGTYTAGIQAHWYPEPHGAVATFSAPSPSLTIHTATQWPYHVKRSVEQILGWESGSVNVSPTMAAGHLDGKIWYPSLVACHAALAACITGNPVKLMLTGEEDFLYAPKRNRAEIEIRSAIGEKGEILGSALTLTLDFGVQGIFKDEIIDQTCLGSLGLYNHPAFRIDAAGIRTNIPVQGPMAGFGLSHGFFAAERHASRIADAAGQDPAEWRKSNFLREQNLAIGTTLKSAVSKSSALKNPIPLPELIDAVAASSDYYRKWASYELLKSSRRGKPLDFIGSIRRISIGRSDFDARFSSVEPLRGIGIATACQGSGFLYNDESGCNNCTVEMRLEKDGSLEIKTSFTGTGHPASPSGIWRNLAQEILGVEGELIRLINTTQEAPDSGIAALSRNISVVTKLVEKCCTAVRNQRFRRPLPITVKRSAKSAKEPGWGSMAKSIESEAFNRPAWGAAVAEVEIDPVSFSPIIRGIWLVVDGGKILSRRRACNALRTGIIQALGWTCREQVFYQEGKIPPELYRAYDIIAPLKVPQIQVDFIRNDSSDPRGIGDIPFSCVPAAYLQAVSQAMDHHFEKIPLQALDIWNAAKQKQQEASS